MGAPDGEIPEMSVTYAQLAGMQDYTQAGIAEDRNVEFRAIAEEARLQFLNTTLGGFLNVIGAITGGINQFISDLVYALKGITGGMIDLTGYFQDEADKLEAKPDVTEIPINSPAWRTMSPNEESTFPRSSLSFGAASGTNSGGSGDGIHSHGLGKVPDYQPQGNGTNWAEIGFIRIEKDGWIDGIGLITGDSNTFASIGAAYVGLYKQNASGDLINMNPLTVGTDRKSSLTSQNTESVFGIGEILPVLQDEWWAVTTLQVTNAIQTAGSLMRTTLTQMNRASGTSYPEKQYAYAGTYSSLPATIPRTALDYDSSTKVPFYYLRRVPAP